MRKFLFVLFALLCIAGCSVSSPRENCGISGIVLFPKERTDKKIGFIRELTIQLLQATSKRGTDATGLVIIEKDKKAKLFKQPEKAKEFVELPGFEKHIENITKDTTIIIGHNRAASVGSPKNNNNNHPVVAGSIYLVHNGEIENHNELFKKYGFKRQGEVDTEVIAQLLNYYSKDGVTIESIQKTCAELKGTMAIAFADERDPYSLYLVRNAMPMTYVTSPKAGLIIFDSELELIHEAWNNFLKPINSIEPDFDEPFKEELKLPENSGVIIDIKKGTVEKFDPFPSKEKKDDNNR